MRSRIILFDDNNALRYSLKILLDREPSFHVVGDFASCTNAAEIAGNLLPDVVIMDIDMPGINGIEGLRQIKETKPNTSIIMYTVFEDDDKLFDSLCAGANGYLLKNSPYERLVDAIKDVLQGGAPMSPTIAKKVLNSFKKQPSKETNYALSDREIEILAYLVKGFSYKMIASECFISLATVQAHIKNIYTKLHVNCGREAVVIALRDRIV